MRDIDIIAETTIINKKITLIQDNETKKFEVQSWDTDEPEPKIETREYMCADHAEITYIDSVEEALLPIIKQVDL